jgi:hypothetical protein
MYTRSSAIWEVVEQLLHLPRTTVMSTPNSANSSPAIAFPSSASMPACCHG